MRSCTRVPFVPSLRKLAPVVSPLRSKSPEPSAQPAAQLRPRTPEQERRRRKRNPLRQSAWARGRCTRRSSAAARTSTAIPPSTQASARPGARDASLSSTPPPCVSLPSLSSPNYLRRLLAMFILTCSSVLPPVGREGLGHHLRPARRHRRGNTRSPARSHAARFVWSTSLVNLLLTWVRLCCPVCAVVVGWFRCRRFAQCCARV